MRPHLFILITAIFALSSCAHTSKISVNVTAPKSVVYSATVRTLVRNGFQVPHTDRESGIVTGERPIRQAVTNREDGRLIRVTVLVEQSEQNSILHVTWTPPEWSFGTFAQEHDEFIRGLTSALPAAKIISDH